MSQTLITAVFLAVGAAPSVDFDTEIIPVLTKAGCNAGSCHGAAAGRGGFRLSLYGSEPSVDYDSIALELEARRVNLARPDSSLFLLKPTCEIDHEGGYRLDADGPGAKRLLRWIQEGARRTNRRELVDFGVTPRLHVAERVGHDVQLHAWAIFGDGSKQDVTRWTAFTAEDPAAVGLDDVTAVATLERRGRHIVVARYLDRVVSVALIVPLSDKPVDLGDEPRRNFIDELIYESLDTLRIPVSPMADDATLLRRLRLDLTGTLPTPEELDAFISSQEPDKRLRMVDQLMQTEEFVDYWTYQLAKLLRIRSRAHDPQGARTYHDWLRKQVRNNVPYDQIARTLLTASGDSHEFGPANFYRTAGDARAHAEFVSELFLGARLRCANCHNHPLDRWKQDDYHGLAAVFARIEKGRVIAISESGEVIHPRTGQAAVPRLPGDRFLAPDADGRVAVNHRGWDTHTDLYTRLKEGYTGAKVPVGLIPSLDLALSALLDDLGARGLLDETLIVVMGEFGRTPKLNTSGGRDHWPRVFSVALAGGGVTGGQVVGASDSVGETPQDRPVTPADLACTIYTLLGIDPSLELRTSDGRPIRLTPHGSRVINELVG